MINNNHTVNILRKTTESPIDIDLYQLIEEGNGSVAQIKEYLYKIDKFISNDSSSKHPDYYELIRQQTALQDHLAIAQNEEEQNPKIQAKAYFGKRLKVTQEELNKKLSRIIENENYTEDQVKGALIYLADEAGIYPRDLEQYYQAIRNQLERKEELRDTKSKLAKLLRLQESKIDISEIIPESYATLIKDWCSLLDFRPECALSAMLAGLSSCHDYRSRILLYKRTGFTQVPTLYSAMAAESGVGKTILFDKFVINPLKPFQDKAEEYYQSERQQALSELNDYKFMSKEDRAQQYPEGQPQLPDRAKRFFYTEATLETFGLQYQAHPGKTILYASDEINKLFKSLNQYSNGRGADGEKLLELYNGGTLCIGRADAEKNIYISETGLSIYGGVQPEVLKEIWGDGNDRDGKSSRFLYTYQPLNNPQLPLEDGEKIICPIDEKLQVLFGLSLNLNPTVYTLSKSASRRFVAYANFLSTQNKNRSNPFMGHVYSKAKGQCGRLIFNLHIVHSIWSKQYTFPNQEIPVEIVDRAIMLTNFYIEQVQLLHQILCPEDDLTPSLREMINLAQSKGKITARDVKMSIWKFRESKTNEIRDLFLNLENMGYGSTEGNGNRLKFFLNQNPQQFYHEKH